MAESRRISVHQALGGGAVADVLLWKRWCSGVFLLIGATSTWLLFERAGYNFFTFVANVLLLLVVILFLWAKSASLLNRPLPPIPDLDVSEESILKVSEVFRVWINRGLSVARDITIERDVKLLLQDQVDDKLIIAHNIILTQCRKIDCTVLKKIQMLSNKEKKTQ